VYVWSQRGSLLDVIDPQAVEWWPPIRSITWSAGAHSPVQSRVIPTYVAMAHI
jgi:hypothetical protein